MATPCRVNSWRILFLSSIVILAVNHLIRSFSYGWEMAESAGGLIIIFLGGAFQWILFRDRFFSGEESIEAMYERKTAVVLGSEFTEKLKFKNFRELAGESFLFRVAVVLTIIVLVLSMDRYEILPLREGAGFFTLLVSLSLAVSFIPDFFYFPVVFSSFSLMEMALRLFGASSTRALIYFIIIGGEIVFFIWLVTYLAKTMRFSFEKCSRYRFDHLDWIKVFLQFAGFLVLCFMLLPEKKEGYFKSKEQDNFLRRGGRYERELRRKYGRELKEIEKDLKTILKGRAKVGGPSNIKNSRRVMELLSSLKKVTGSWEIRRGGEQKFAPDEMNLPEGSIKPDPARLEEIIKHLTEMEKQMRSTSMGGRRNELQKSSGEGHIDSTGESEKLLKAINSLKEIKSDIEGSGGVVNKDKAISSRGLPSSIEKVASETLPEAEGESGKDILSETEKSSSNLKAVNRNMDFRKTPVLLKEKLKKFFEAFIMFLAFVLLIFMILRKPLLRDGKKKSRKERVELARLTRNFNERCVDFLSGKKELRIASRASVVAMYNIFLEHLRDCGMGKPGSMTPDEFAGCLGRRYPGKWKEIKVVTEVFTDAFYGSVSPRNRLFDSYIRGIAGLAHYIPFR